MKKNLFKICIITVMIIFIMKYSSLLKINIYNISLLFIKEIMPFMFPIIFISNYIRYNILPTNNNIFIYKLSLCFSFAPSNVLLTNNTKLITYSTNLNPIYSYTIIKALLNKNTSLLIVLTNLLINYILIFKTKINKNISLEIESKKITEIINISIKNILNIYGVILFFNIIITILTNTIFKPLLFLIEVTNGFYILNSMTNNFIKTILIIYLNSFCGLSIYFQQKSINNNVNTYSLTKKLKLSFIILIITVLLLHVVELLF